MECFLKGMPFTKNDLEKIATKFPTPFHIYDEKAIRENARDLLQSFAWNEGFKEYFAVKATPNPFILKILKTKVNELNPDYFVGTADMLFDLALDIKDKLRILTGFVNISGGIGIPYTPDEEKVSLAYVGEGIGKKYQEKIRKNGLHPLSIFMECGRAITGPYGYWYPGYCTKRKFIKPISASTQAWRI